MPPSHPRPLILLYLDRTPRVFVFQQDRLKPVVRHMSRSVLNNTRSRSGLLRVCACYKALIAPGISFKMTPDVRTCSPACHVTS